MENVKFTIIILLCISLFQPIYFLGKKTTGKKIQFLEKEWFNYFTLFIDIICIGLIYIKYLYNKDQNAEYNIKSFFLGVEYEDGERGELFDEYGNAPYLKWFNIIYILSSILMNINKNNNNNFSKYSKIVISILKIIFILLQINFTVSYEE